MEDWLVGPQKEHGDALFFHEKVTDFLPSDQCIIKTHHKTISFRETAKS